MTAESSGWISGKAEFPEPLPGVWKVPLSGFQARGYNQKAELIDNFCQFEKLR
jgi:hypothetical protein